MISKPNRSCPRFDSNCLNTQLVCIVASRDVEAKLPPNERALDAFVFVLSFASDLSQRATGTKGSKWHWACGARER